MQHSGPRPVVQWVCSSMGMPLQFSYITGTSVRMRSGVSRPPGSLRQMIGTSSEAASRVFRAKYSSVCLGDTE